MPTSESLSTQNHDSFLPSQSYSSGHNSLTDPLALASVSRVHPASVEATMYPRMPHPYDSSPWFKSSIEPRAQATARQAFWEVHGNPNVVRFKRVWQLIPSIFDSFHRITSRILHRKFINTHCGFRGESPSLSTPSLSWIGCYESFAPNLHRWTIIFPRHVRVIAFNTKRNNTDDSTIHGSSDMRLSKLSRQRETQCNWGAFQEENPTHLSYSWVWKSLRQNVAPKGSSSMAYWWAAICM